MIEEIEDDEDELVEIIASLADDPVGYVEFAFPWDEEGGPLEGHTLRDWQRGWLQELGEEIRSRKFDGFNPVSPVQCSTVSGHGIGKSALTSMVIKFIHDTRPYSRGVVTANTSEQLRTKTWAECGKWHKMSITSHWSEYRSTRGNMSLASNADPSGWRVDAQTCREENSEAFAGLHAVNSTPFYIFDEASAVPEAIYEVASGGLTDGEPMWFLFGNGTRNSGRFFETHNRLKHRWLHKNIDSRDVEGTNKELFQTWIDDFGEDSDYVKVRVRGMFPSAGSLQFISSDVVDDCMAMKDSEGVAGLTDPIIIGCDIARFGDDQTVLWVRRGRDARNFGLYKYRGLDTMQTASRIAELASDLSPDAIFVDGGGVGGGVCDRLNQLQIDHIEVNFGGKATSPECLNMRAQMWLNMRNALKDGVLLPSDIEVRADLTGVEYAFNQANKIKLEPKEDMKKRGLASPDLADALALTYAYPVGPRDASLNHKDKLTRPAGLVTDHEDVFEGN
ncbi:MAG: terminase [Pseudomonadales bacterium]